MRTHESSTIAWLCLAALGATTEVAAKPRSAIPPQRHVPVLVRVASCNGKPVRDPAWVNLHLTAASAIFARHGVVLDATVEAFAPATCVVLSANDRHQLATHARTDRVSVLIIERAADLDVPDYNLMGVHWRYRGADKALAGRRYVIFTARATPPVLAHELCHFFGLPHDRAGGNLMTPGPSDPAWQDKQRPPRPFAPLLTARQARRLRAGVTEFLAAQRGTDDRRRPTP